MLFHSLELLSSSLLNTKDTDRENNEGRSNYFWLFYML